MPIIVHTIAELQTALAGHRPAFVPTMGALHAGHAALIQRARDIAGPAPAMVAVSIFVNPTQFGPGEDFARYPRQLEQDVELCKQAGADVIFAPSVEAMYPAGPAKVSDTFLMPALPPVATQPQLEDAFRPDHFKGVCQVVARLFDIVQPAHAIFGEKDYQQLLVISAMVAQENAAAERAALSPAAQGGAGNPRTRTSSSTAHPSQRWPGLQIIPHPTVREPDGLALSSRNAYLTGEWRQRALALHEALELAQRLAQRGNTPRDIENAMTSHLFTRGFAVDYAAVRDANTLMPVERIDRSCRALIAARAALTGGGGVRLIDNMPIASSRDL
jgi:pantoate--beta-alanine ligase